MTTELVAWFDAFNRMQDAVHTDQLNRIREANVQLRAAYARAVKVARRSTLSRRRMNQIQILAQGPDAVRRLKAYFSEIRTL